MASSRRPAPDTGASAVVDTLVGWLAGPAAGRRILVAVSGGLDSMVLLDALAGLVPPERPHVGHVDHALQPGSGRWA
ncbi:MAG: tRNA(Ile)-lysidine synthetase, partial [Gemmatimonadales bacterium]|nr:tRNA(Ile)-lysidine synthetase [Gemmatimonadales bacterium]